MVQAITPEDITGVAGILQQILSNDNEQRKVAEAQLNTAKSTETSKYAILMASILDPHQTAVSVEAKSLAAVILRRNVSTEATDASDLQNQENNVNLWKRLSDDARNAVKASLLETLNKVDATNKTFMHKVCNVAVEVQGAMCAEENDAIWQDLLNLLFSFIQGEEEAKIDTALTIFNGLFSYILDHLVKYKNELGQIFERTLQFQSLDIKLAALQAVSNYLSVAERKDTKEFIKLLPLMTAVVTQAFTEEDESVLEDALVEFNELAEIEPQFFRADFQAIYTAFKPIVAHSDFANASIRHQPLEFCVTMIERKPSLIKKDEALAKDVLESIFQLMIDIDTDIDADWMRPKEGFAGEDEEEDNVNFGKTAVDRLIAGVGDAHMLPLIATLVQNTISNETDWRYKHAGIMAFSQVGEYVDEVEKIRPMMPTIFQHLQHENPKIRYAALHCVGQLADDMPGDFQKTFAPEAMPAMIAALDDQVPRVQSHACACLTNFVENASKEIIAPAMQELSQKLCLLVKDGISMTKENAVTTLGTVVEKVGEDFIPYFNESIDFILTYLAQFHTAEYKQFRGQALETITIICSAVGLDAFRPVAQRVVDAMLSIQTTQLDAKDSQRIYLLGAWQRVCLLMKAEFAPHLNSVLPSVLTMAALSPEMGVSGQDTLAELTDVLKEVTPAGGAETGEKAMNVVTDEIEEKDVALQMLSVFIDEVPEVCYDYISQLSTLLMAQTSYAGNDSIRGTSASCLPGLMKAAKSRNVDTATLHQMAKEYNTNLYNAMKEELDTDTLITQVQAFKDVIDEAGPGLMTAEEVAHLSDKSVDIVNKSLERIAQNNKLPDEQEIEDEDDVLDADDLALIKEENSNEFDLQIAAAELMGALFKTHKDFVAPLVGRLRNEIIPACFGSSEQKRYKFALFILDDMVEHLGPSYFPESDFQSIVQAICGFSSHQSASLRQASAYGIGVVAQNAGAAFATCSELCLSSLKNGVDFELSAKIQGKKEKLQMYHHARDNAIASIGKVIKYQTGLVQSNPTLGGQLVSFWLGLLPITHDIEEAVAQYDYLSTFLLEQPEFILGQDPATAAQQLAKVYGEAFQDKYTKEMKEPAEKLKLANAVRYLLTAAPAPVPDAFKAACENVLAADAQANVTAAFNFNG